jgi:hypothetical protein
MAPSPLRTFCSTATLFACLTLKAEAEPVEAVLELRALCLD